MVTYGKLCLIIIISASIALITSAYMNGGVEAALAAYAGCAFLVAWCIWFPNHMKS